MTAERECGENNADDNGEHAHELPPPQRAAAGGEIGDAFCTIIERAVDPRCEL
ncbi:hypothetical protein NLL32_07805 [Corynebacterium propinquum]|uniref:hypothetical protein n=1 Tax=Corynebacterium propinquum TaxID=43769 RepID=UPI00266F1CD8|nr:hypothetical protein [Corynebacterium propinquum]WKS45651.1 hypothetical protein NLL36_03755 [Corynebacterium propinquum]WKS48650.1 hypothetical protein NLL32_07805 [Corynebacterium propinquum]